MGQEVEETDGSEGGPVVASTRPAQKRRRNTRLRAPGLAALTPSDISLVSDELEEFVEQVNDIFPPLPQI